MDPQKNWEELFNWANEDEKNRKKAINFASKFIVILNSTSGKKISKEEMNKIAGGFSGGTPIWTNTTMHG